MGDTKNFDFDTITNYFSLSISSIDYYVITFFQLFKNNIIFTCFGFITLLPCEISSPALEKTLSAGTEVPGMLMYFLANLERKGNARAQNNR